MAEAGASVTIADLKEETGARAAGELSSKGLSVQYVRYDVVSYSSQVAAFKSAVAFGGNKLDMVVLSAGIIGKWNLFDMVAFTEPRADAGLPKPGCSAVDIKLRCVYYGAYLALSKNPRSGSISYHLGLPKSPWQEKVARASSLGTHPSKASLMPS